MRIFSEAAWLYPNASWIEHGFTDVKYCVRSIVFTTSFHGYFSHTHASIMIYDNTFITLNRWETCFNWENVLIMLNHWETPLRAVFPNYASVYIETGYFVITTRWIYSYLPQSLLLCLLLNLVIQLFSETSPNYKVLAWRKPRGQNSLLDRQTAHVWTWFRNKYYFDMEKRYHSFISSLCYCINNKGIPE